MLMLKLLIGLGVIYTIVCCLFPAFEVCGESMHPTLKEGDKIVTIRCFNKRNLILRNIYAFKAPNDKEGRIVVKRLIGRNKSGQCYFTGDNREKSYDSRYYGYVNSKQVISRFLFKI